MARLEKKENDIYSSSSEGGRLLKDGIGIGRRLFSLSSSAPKALLFGPNGWAGLIIIGVLTFISFMAVISTASLTSQSQMDGVLSLSALGVSESEYRVPKDVQGAIYDPNVPREETSFLLSIIDSKKAVDRLAQIAKIEQEILEMGYDVGLSMQFLEESSQQESEFESDALAAFSRSSNTFLSAFSVAMDNGQIRKVGVAKYVNNLGVEVETYKFGEKAGELNYSKTLGKLLSDYIKGGGHFYDITYEMEGDHIKVYTDVTTYTETKEVEVTNPETGEVTKKEETVTRTIIRYYVHPILVEKDVSSLSEKIFNLDFDSLYSNSVGTPKSEITVGEAVSLITQATISLMYGFNVSSDVYFASGFNGKYEWPAPGNYKVTSPYGYRVHPITRKYSLHSGLDISGALGSPVVAAEDGTVIYAGSSGSYGTLIRITHDDGTETRYAHLLATAVFSGEKVRKGQQIGLVGSSGQSTGPHLHFEIRVNGSPIDPRPWIVGE